jgi:hypothetical protein
LHLYLTAGGSYSFDATLLREKSPFVQSVLQSVSSDGLIIASTGTYPFSSSRYVPREMYVDPSEEHNDEHSTLHDWIIHLLGDGPIIKKCMEYSEFVPNYNSKSVRQQLQRFIILMKDKKLMSNWIVSDAEINAATRTLMAKPSSFDDVEDISLPLLHFFDGASMNTYAFPSRVAEDIWCKDNWDCYLRNGYDPYIPNVPLSKSFNVRVSTKENGGRGVFATVPIPKGSYLGLEETVHSMYVRPNTYALLERLASQQYKHEMLCFGYLRGYGWFENTIVSKSTMLKKIRM